MRWTLYSWNINGIRAAEKKGLLDWLAHTNADVVALQETKAHPDQLSNNLRNPAGYTAAWCSAEKKGYSGVCTYSRVTPVGVKYGLEDARFDHDGRVIFTEYEPFVLANVYFPNGGRGPEWVAHKLRFYKRLLEIAQGHMAAGRSLVITGDANTSFAEIDLARPKENVKQSGFMPEERLALGEYFQAGLIDTFRHKYPDRVGYTWWNQVTRARERNVGWRLDYFFVSPDLRDRIVDADIHDSIMGSDHCPVSLVLDL